MCPKAGDIDWSDLYKTGKSIAPEDSLSRPVGVDSHKGGEKITKADLLKDAEKIIAGYQGPLGQPTKEQEEACIKALFPELAATPEELAKKEANWKNTFNNFFKEVNKPCDNKEVAWASGKSFNSTLTEEELAERNAFVGRE